jgi:hypothetical protein
MERRLSGELPVAYLFGPSGVGELLPVVIANPGMYQPVRIVDERSNETGSLFIQLATEKSQKYLKFTEFSDEAIFDLFRRQFGNKAIRIEETLGFKVKF